MKIFLPIFLLFASLSFADYSNHPEAKDLIDSLIKDHNFEREYVVEVLKAAQKKDNILKSMSSPAEFTWTWDIREFYDLEGLWGETTLTQTPE